jgi:UDP-GlcNAc:undecaprenyl-phosphate GlcNAc-1-phosphate transferase
MAGVLVPFLMAVVLSASGVWLLARIAPRLGAVSAVRVDRWHKSENISRLAGPAILLAMAPWLPLGHLGVLACVTMVGTVDDIGALGPGTKALALAIAAGLAGIVTGSPWVAIAVWVACNATNMLDHADGLAGCTIAAAFLGIGGEAGFAGAGAALGFLFFNYPRGRVFMGDSGSLLLGAAVVLAASGRGPLVTIGWMAVPLIDAGFVVLRRIRAGRKPWVGGTDHLGHLLLISGTPGWLLPLLYAGAAFVIGLGVEDLA